MNLYILHITIHKDSNNYNQSYMKRVFNRFNFLQWFNNLKGFWRHYTIFTNFRLLLNYFTSDCPICLFILWVLTSKFIRRRKNQSVPDCRGLKFKSTILKPLQGSLTKSVFFLITGYLVLEKIFKTSHPISIFS